MKGIQTMLITLALLILAISCSKGAFKFFDLEKAYSADIKIDMNDLSNKINQMVKNVKAKNDSLPNDYAKSRLDNIISVLGFVDTYDDGKKISPLECNEISAEIYKNLTDCIILDDCPKNNSSDFCTEKWDTYNSLKNFDVNYKNFVVNSSADEFMNMYKKKHITKEELDFLIMNMYLMISINNIE